MSNAPDNRSLEQLKAAVRADTDATLDNSSANAGALKVDSVSAADDATSQRAAEQISTASYETLASADYLTSRAALSYAERQSAWDRLLEDTKRQLLTEAAVNLNAFTRQSLEEALRLLGDLEALVDEIGAECNKIVLAAAMGLLVPPVHEEVVELRTKTQQTHDMARDNADDLRSASARRLAAKRQLDIEPESNAEGTKRVPGRSIEPMTIAQKDDAPSTMNTAYAAAAPTAPSLENQARAQGRTDVRLQTQSQELQTSVLEKISYIGICMAMSQLNTSKDTRDRAVATFQKIMALIETILGSLESGFVSGLQSLIQESVVGVIDSLANTLQDKLDAFDTWLALLPKQLPTLVSLVQEFGDRASDAPILESLAGYCDLKMSSFCEAQGLLEIAMSLDAMIGNLLPRPPALGRVRLLAVAPTAETDYRPVSTVPDQQTDMFLVSVLGDRVTARLPRAEKKTVSMPTPRLAGTLTEDVDAGQATLTISGLAANVAPLGTIVVLSTSLRYGSWTIVGTNHVFTLIDLPPIDYEAATPVTVSGEYRDTFVDAFGPSPNIHGGPGTMTLAGDGEVREEITYSASTFVASTGIYTFELDSAPAHDHQFQALGKTHELRDELLYKPTDIKTQARRFRVIGDRVYPLTPAPYAIDTAFDFTSAAGMTLIIDDAGEYSPTGGYRLLIGDEPVAVALGACQLTAPNAYLGLTTAFHAGDQERVTISRSTVPVAKGTNWALTRLDSRQKTELMVADLGIGATSLSVAGRVVLSQDVVRVTDTLVSVSGTGPTQTLIVAGIGLRGDESGLSIELPGVVTPFTAHVDSVAGNVIDCTPIAKTEHVDLTNDTLTAATGSDIVFAREFGVGDLVYVQGMGNETVLTIDATTNTMTVAATGLTLVDKQISLLAAPGATTAKYTIVRATQEVREFLSITNIDNVVYRLNLETVTGYTHDLQNLTLVPSLRVVTNTITDYLSQFSAPADSAKPRFDGKTLPPGSTILRAELENQSPAYQLLFDAFIKNAAKVIVGGRELAVNAPATASGFVYAFDMAAGTPWPIVDGDVVEVETTSVFDQIQNLFPSATWAKPFDDFFKDLASRLRVLETKFCRMLSGRPLDIGVTALAISGACGTFKFGVIWPTKFIIQTLILGLPTSPTIALAVQKFEAAGMDRAAEVTRHGDVTAIAQMTAATSTFAGTTQESVLAYRGSLVIYSDVQAADDIVSGLRSEDQNKALLLEVRRPYTEAARDKWTNTREAARIRAQKADEVTSR